MELESELEQDDANMDFAQLNLGHSFSMTLKKMQTEWEAEFESSSTHSFNSLLSRELEEYCQGLSKQFDSAFPEEAIDNNKKKKGTSHLNWGCDYCPFKSQSGTLLSEHISKEHESAFAYFETVWSKLCSENILFEEILSSFPYSIRLIKSLSPPEILKSWPSVETIQFQDYPSKTSPLPILV